MKLLCLTLHCLPILGTWLPNTGAWTDCYWASRVKRSLPVTPDMLAWPDWAQSHHGGPVQRLLICFFLCLSGRNESLWDCMHGLNFIILPADQSGTSQIASVSNQMWAVNGEWEMKIQEVGMERNQSITEQGSSENLRLSAQEYDSGWNVVSESMVFEEFKEMISFVNYLLSWTPFLHDWLFKKIYFVLVVIQKSYINPWNSIYFNFMWLTNLLNTIKIYLRCNTNSGH